MFMFTKIITENQAKEFVQFATKKFKMVEHLRDWILPVSDELGVVPKTEFTIICLGNDKAQIKQRRFLMLELGENKTIIFVGNVYQNWHNNTILGTVDFSEEQNHVKTFIDLQVKNEQYFEQLKQTEKMHYEVQNMLDLCKLCL